MKGGSKRGHFEQLVLNLLYLAEHPMQEETKVIIIVLACKLQRPHAAP